MFESAGYRQFRYFFNERYNYNQDKRSVLCFASSFVRLIFTLNILIPAAGPVERRRAARCERLVCDRYGYTILHRKIVGYFLVDKPALCLGFHRFELCQKGPFKSTSFLVIFAILICRKINELSTSENLLSKCDLNGPFCYT